MTDHPIRVRRSRAKGARLPDNTVCVDRSTDFGNPFVVGQDGNAATCVWLFMHLMAGNVCLNAKVSVEDQMSARTKIISKLPDLRGKNLACWCLINQPCHADVLLTCANAETPA